MCTARKPGVMEFPCDVGLERGRHEAQQLPLLRDSVQVRRLMEVLAQLPAHRRRQATACHELVQLVELTLEGGVRRMEGGGDVGGERMPPGHRPQQGESGRHSLLRRVARARRRLTQSHRRDCADRPMQRRRVDGSRGVAVHRAFGVLGGVGVVGRVGRVGGVGGVAEQRRLRGRGSAVVGAEPCRQHIVLERGLEPPDACEGVREEEHAHSALDEGGDVVADGGAHLP